MFHRRAKQLLVWKRFSWSQLFQGRYLLLTNTLTGGSLMALGDGLEQSWQIHKEPGRVRDWRRTGLMFVVGAAFVPPMHYWYLWLDRVLPGRTLATVLKKVLLDELIISPVWGLGFFQSLTLMEGRTLSAGWEEYKEKFWEMIKADCTVWPAAQMINFYYLPNRFRILYINGVTVGWNGYMSHLRYRDDDPTAHMSEEGEPEEAVRL